MRRITSDSKAFGYFEGTLAASREKHTYLKKSLPESTSAFAEKYAEGAVGKSGRKIKVNGLQAKWPRANRQYPCSAAPRASDRPLFGFSTYKIQFGK